MAIIYTYPPISDLQLDDLVVVTDKSNKNSTRQASISQILDLSPPVVDSLNGFTGDVNIIAGNNISVDNVTGQNNIEISTSSNTISSGNNGEFAFFAGTGSTLEGSPLLTTSSNRVYLQDYIYHKDNSTGNNAFFGFAADNRFLIYLDAGAQERLELRDDYFAVFTGVTPKISAGDTYASLAHDLVTADPTRSSSVLLTTENGVNVSTTYRSDVAGSDLGFGGQIKFLTSASSSTYVGLMGPITSELTANYNLMLPNTPPTSGQLLAAGATAQGTPPNMYRKLEWIDGSSAVGVTQLTAGSGISLTPSSGVGIVEVSALSAVIQKVIAVEALSKGDAVYISGGTGDNPEVSKAQANSPSTMAALGIMKDNTNINDIGECVTSGEITGLNLTGFTTGDELFISNITAGELLTSAPKGEDNLIQKIGKVIKGGNGGALTVLGAFRTNATPNLDKGNIFVGNAVNQSSVLSVGADNYVLKANNAAPQGVEWVEDEGIKPSINGITTNDFPVTKGPNTVGDSIMSQDVDTPNPTHHRVKIESPAVDPNLGQFPSLQLYNGSNGSWSTGAILSEIQTYSADGSGPSNPHVCSFINTVQGTVSSGASATDGELVFGTAPYGKPVGAQESMRIDKQGSILVKQVGISTDNNYRTGNVSVQNTGEFRLYGSNPFTSANYHSIRNNNGALEIGDQTGFSGTINFFVDQASALEINDSAESTFKGGDTTIEENLTVNKGATVEGHFTLPEVPIVPSGSPSTATCDLTLGNQFRIASMNSNTIVTFTNAVSGDEFTLSVTRTQNGSGSNITWSNAYWPDDIDPSETLSENKVDIYKFTKVGSDIFGRVVGLNYTIQS